VEKMRFSMKTSKWTYDVTPRSYIGKMRKSPHKVDGL
jgi:hypothetical protein